MRGHAATRERDIDDLRGTGGVLSLHLGTIFAFSG
jgi:hypothetical protein